MKKVKMARVLLRYVGEVLQHHGLALNDNLVSLGIAAWNVASLSPKERRDAESTLYQSISQRVADEAQFEMVKELIKEMIHYKLKKFSHIRNYVVSFQLLPGKDREGFHLTVNSVPL